jgi:hypothetical protein
VKENLRGGACGTHGTDEKLIRYFGHEIGMEVTTWET